VHGVVSKNPDIFFSCRKENPTMSKYDEKIRNSFEEIRQCYQALCPESGIIAKLGISRRTFDRYRNEYPEFRTLIDECREEAASRAAEEVENALLKRATGYDVEGDTPKHIPPDVRAAIFFLKNRRPGSWKDRQEIALPELPEIRLTVEEKDL
jgi:hypothetical protein